MLIETQACATRYQRDGKPPHVVAAHGPAANAAEISL
ncbi:hypothetical protein EDF57_104339 [Novosphingobium sp. PhB55]|jgi:hypothetical protein|nr:hypothetical protein EDF57_104339 [Novosphingobium sp. PhB55]